MNKPYLTLARFDILAVIASGVLLSAGCANMATTASPDITGAQSSLTGRVHGGNQPVSGATVYLYGVGQTGVGSSAVLYATTTTANNGTGSFSFNQQPGQNSSGSPISPSTPNYQCPSGIQPLLYIYTKGGNTTGSGSSTNSAAAFLAPVGYCNVVNNSTFVDVSEVSTVATVAAVAQFINPSNDQIGNDGIGVAYAAMGNAFATIPNLVNAATGLASTTTTIAGTGTAAGVNMTATAPTAQLNTIANIISACVNQATSTSANNCNTLFTDAVPPASAALTSQPNATFNTATDTVQAALYMFLNPTNGRSPSAMTGLFNLQAAAAPFTPALTAAPQNWLLSMTYATQNPCGTQNSSTFLSHPYDLNFDIDGNMWIANNSGVNSAIAQMSPNGKPLTCVTTGGSSLGGGVVDIGTQSNGSNPTVWYTDNSGGHVYGYTEATGQLRTFPAPGATAITADGTGNVFFTAIVGGVGSVYELVNANNTSDTSNPVQIATNVGPNPARIFPDSANDLWVTSGSNFVTELVNTPTGSGGHNYVSSQIAVTGPTYGLIVGPGNRIYITSQDSNSTETILSPNTVGTTTTFSVLYTTAAANTGGLNKPTQLWIDGAQNSWVGNFNPDSNAPWALSVLSPTLTAISPSGTSGGYQSTTIAAPRTTVVDSIGNVWVVGDNSPNLITSFLGAAVPIMAPYPYGIQASRFQTIP